MAEVLVFGATSMVGSHFVRHSRLQVHAAGRTDPARVELGTKAYSAVDLEKIEEVEAFVRERPEPVVVNFAARTDVDNIEKARTPSGVPASGDSAWKINALAPEAIARGALHGRKRFVQISTDFVFDGTSGPYDESMAGSALSPKLSWYGWTKSEGERRVRSIYPEATILRIAYPYRSVFPWKLDFARGLVARQRQGTLPALYTDQFLTPTWVPDVTKAILALINANEPGTFHAASPDRTTPFDFARALFQRIGFGQVPLSRGSLVETLRNPAATPRPVSGGLKSDRLARLGVPLTSWQDGIEKLAREEGWV